MDTNEHQLPWVMARWAFRQVVECARALALWKIRRVLSLSKFGVTKTTIQSGAAARALQDAGAFEGALVLPPGCGVRQPSAALKSIVEKITLMEKT